MSDKKSNGSTDYTTKWLHIQYELAKGLNCKVVAVIEKQLASIIDEETGNKALSNILAITTNCIGFNKFDFVFFATWYEVEGTPTNWRNFVQSWGRLREERNVLRLVPNAGMLYFEPFDDFDNNKGFTLTIS